MTRGTPTAVVAARLAARLAAKLSAKLSAKPAARLGARLGARLAAGLAAGIFLAAAAPRLAAIPLSRADLPWWAHRLAAKQAELRAGPVELVFYGDSITQDFELAGPEPWRDFAPVWQHYYAGRHALNLGFKGDTTAHLLWRIENGEAAGIHPKAAVVLIGANNFGRLRWPAPETEAGIVRIIAALETRLPGTSILLLGVLPSIRNAWVDENTAALNAALARRYAHDPVVTFKDVGAIFRANRSPRGAVDPDRFLDPRLHPPEPPLHPDAQAAADLAATIEPTIAAMLGDHPRPRMTAP